MDQETYLLKVLVNHLLFSVELHTGYRMNISLVRLCTKQFVFYNLKLCIITYNSTLIL